MMAFPIRPELVDKSQPYTMLSIAGENYKIKSSEKKVVIAFHRSFTERELIAFLSEVATSRHPRSYRPMPTHEPLIITKDPKNLDNKEYQQAALSKIVAGIEAGGEPPGGT